MIHPSIPITLRDGRFYAITPDSAEMEGLSRCVEQAGRPFNVRWDGFEHGFVMDCTRAELSLPGVQLYTRVELDQMEQTLTEMRRTNAWSYIRATAPQLEEILGLLSQMYDRPITGRDNWDNIISGHHARKVLLAARELSIRKSPQELTHEDEQTLFTARLFLEKAMEPR